MNLGVVISFAAFHSSNNSFTFAPQISSARTNPYSIEILLTDESTSPKSSKYILQVTVPMQGQDVAISTEA